MSLRQNQQKLKILADNFCKKMEKSSISSEMEGFVHLGWSQASQRPNDEITLAVLNQENLTNFATDLKTAVEQITNCKRIVRTPKISY